MPRRQAMARCERVKRKNLAAVGFAMPHQQPPRLQGSPLRGSTVTKRKRQTIKIVFVEEG